MPQEKTYGVWLLIACHLLIVLPLAWYLNVWSDEASSLYSTESLRFAFHDGAIIERQAPLYFWALALWREINDSVLFARLLSVLFSVASIWFFSGLAERVLRSVRAAILATAFLALHPILIWASCEIRVYALVILLSIALLRTYLSGFFDDEKARGLKPKISFLLLAIIAIYTNYYLGFLLVGLFGGLLITGKWRAAAEYLGAMAITAFAGSPLGLILGPQFAANTTDIGETPTVLGGMQHIWGHVLTFILPADIRLGHETTDVGTVRLWLIRVLIAVTFVVEIVRRRRISQISIALGAVSVTVFLGLLTAYFFVGVSLVELRHASVMFVALILFAASLIKDVYGSGDDRGVWKYAVTLASVLVLWFFWYAASGMYPNLAKNGDWSRVAAYIQQHEKPGQPIIVFHTYDTLVMPYAYHGVNSVFPDERYFDFDFGVPTPERLKERTEFTISKIPPDANEIWLITSDECRQPGVCEQLEQYLNANFLVVDQHPFYRNSVTLLRRRALPMIVSE